MTDNYDVVVVGAGPSGARTAGLLAQKGYSVALLEEHAKIGLPVHCSGFVTPRTLAVAGLSDSLVLNKIKGAHVYSSNGKMITLGGDQDRAFVLDRASLDQKIVESSLESGADLYLGNRVKSIETLNSHMEIQVQKKNSRIRYKSRSIVGADGVRSIVAEHFGRATGQMIWCIGAEARILDHPMDMVRIYVGDTIAPGWFAWTIPIEPHKVRIGLGTIMNTSQKKPRTFFNELLSRFPNHFKGLEIESFGGGFIPLYTNAQTYFNRTLLVGDAALQVKPTSGGGIYMGLKGAEYAATSLDEALQSDALAEKNLSTYQERWTKEIGLELKRGLDIRNKYLSLGDSQLERMIDILNIPLFKSKINRYGDIDYPSRMFGVLLGLAPILKGVLGLPDILPLPWRRVVDRDNWQQILKG